MRKENVGLPHSVQAARISSTMN